MAIVYIKVRNKLSIKGEDGKIWLVLKHRTVGGSADIVTDQDVCALIERRLAKPMSESSLLAAATRSAGGGGGKVAVLDVDDEYNAEGDVDAAPTKKTKPVPASSSSNTSIVATGSLGSGKKNTSNSNSSGGSNSNDQQHQPRRHSGSHKHPNHASTHTAAATTTTSSTSTSTGSVEKASPDHTVSPRGEGVHLHKQPSRLGSHTAGGTGGAGGGASSGHRARAKSDPPTAHQKKKSTSHNDKRKSTGPLHAKFASNSSTTTKTDTAAGIHRDDHDDDDDDSAGINKHGTGMAMATQNSNGNISATGASPTSSTSILPEGLFRTFSAITSSMKQGMDGIRRSFIQSQDGGDHDNDNDNDAGEDEDHVTPLAVAVKQKPEPDDSEAILRSLFNPPPTAPAERETESEPVLNRGDTSNSSKNNSGSSKNEDTSDNSSGHARIVVHREFSKSQLVATPCPPMNPNHEAHTGYLEPTLHNDEDAAEVYQTRLLDATAATINSEIDFEDGSEIRSNSSTLSAGNGRGDASGFRPGVSRRRTNASRNDADVIGGEGGDDSEEKEEEEEVEEGEEEDQEDTGGGGTIGSRSSSQKAKGSHHHHHHRHHHHNHGGGANKNATFSGNRFIQRQLQRKKDQEVAEAEATARMKAAVAADFIKEAQEHAHLGEPPTTAHNMIDC